MNNPDLELLRRSYILALSPEEQEEAFAELGGQLFIRVIARVMDVLPVSDGDHLAGLLEKNAEGSEVITFLTKCLPGIEGIISEEARVLVKDRAELLPA
jgi:hypothetical protein